MVKLLLDCDPGHDDALALLYAARRCELVAVTTVFGNQTLERTTRNALALCRLAALDVPVAAGCARPLLGEPIDGGSVHGATGLDGAELPEPDRAPEAMHAVEMILRQARAHRGALHVAVTGAATNLALALRTEPRLAEWLAGITLMAGTTGIGNATPVAEFNVVCDPEALDVVLRAGVPTWMVGLDVTRRVGAGPAEIAQLRQDGGRVGAVMADLLQFYLDSLGRMHGLTTASLHDPCAIIPLVAPELIAYRHTHVEVELGSPVTRGMTVCDLRRLGAASLGHIRPARAPNVWLAREPDAPGILRELLAAVASYA